MCFPLYEDLGTFGGLILARDPETGNHLLLAPPAHNGDVLVTFTAPPRSDPITQELEQLAEACDSDGEPCPAALRDAFDQSDDWLREAEAAMAPLHRALSINGCHDLVVELQAVGYDQAQHGTLELWLYSQLGQLAVGGTARP